MRKSIDHIMLASPDIDIEHTVGSALVKADLIVPLLCEGSISR